MQRGLARATKHGMGDAHALLTASEVADRLGVSRQTVYRWAKAQLLGSLKVGGVVRFRPSDVDEFMERSTREAAEVSA